MTGGFIADGYGEIGEVSGWHYLYRPLLRHQRAVLRSLRDLPDDLFRAMAVRLVEQQVVAADWDSVDALPDDVFVEVFSVVTGTGRNEQEKCDEANLSEYVRLESQYPWLAHTSCESCRYWWFNPLEGRTARRDGVPLRRPEGGRLLCQTPIGCPKGTPETAPRLSEKNRDALRHWEAEGGAGDAIVNRNARIIRDARQAAKAHG